jgi:uncharacterized protein (DUF4415 family)
MKKTAAEPYRDIDFTAAKRGPVVSPDPGKTKISIRLDNRVLDHFRRIVENAGGGNYQTLINNALVDYIQQQSMLEAVRQAVREELEPALEQAGLTKAEHRAILEEVLLRPEKKLFAAVLAEIPNVGKNEDFARLEKEDEVPHVFD